MVPRLALGLKKPWDYKYTPLPEMLFIKKENHQNTLLLWLAINTITAKRHYQKMRWQTRHVLG